MDTRGHRVAGKMFVGRIMQHSSNHIMVELVDTSHTTEDNKQLIMVLKSPVPDCKLTHIFRIEELRLEIDGQRVIF